MGKHDSGIEGEAGIRRSSKRLGDLIAHFHPGGYRDYVRAGVGIATILVVVTALAVAAGRA